MPFTDAKIPSELSDRAVVERACRMRCRHVRETWYGVHERGPGASSTAAKTRPESRAFRQAGDSKKRRRSDTKRARGTPAGSTPVDVMPTKNSPSMCVTRA